MSIADLNRRIKRKLEELNDDRHEREQARRVLQRREARVDEVVDELGKARRRIKRRREAVGELTRAIDDSAGTPDEDPAQEEEQRARLDELAGELEEAISVRDLLLAKLDRLQEKRDDAKRELEKAARESDEDRDAIQRMRARRARIKERREDKASPHFSYAEFDCNDGTALPKRSEAAVADWCRRIGEPLRNRFGEVHVNSGFRHAAYNRRVGGETNSVHIYDFPGRDFKAVAVDVWCDRGTPADWYAFTAGKADGRGRYATFHHADTRNRIGWPDATWTG